MNWNGIGLPEKNNSEDDMRALVLTKQEMDEIFQSLWNKNIFEKGINEPPSLGEFIKEVKRANRDKRIIMNLSEFEHRH